MLRCTHSYLSVLGRNTGALRTTHTYVSVLCQNAYTSLTDSSIPLSQEASVSLTGVHNALASSAIIITSAGNTVMALRSTQTYVSVLGRDLGTLRSTQTYVSVLCEHNTGGSEYNVTAESTLTLSDEVLSGLYSRTAESVLAITSEATAPKIYNPVAESTLALVSASIGLPPHERTAFDTLELTQDALSGIYFASAEDSLLLTDVGRRTETYTAVATSSLVLSDVVSTLPTGRVDATNVLLFSQDADNNVKVRFLTDVIALTSAATAFTVKQASNTIELVDGAVQGIISFTITDTLELVSSAKNAFFRLFTEEQTLTLSDSARSSIRMLNVPDAIEVTDTLVVIRPWYVSATDELLSIEQVYDLDTDSLIDVVTGLDQTASVTVFGPRTASNIISFVQTAIGSHVRADGISVEAVDELAIDDVAQISITADAGDSLTVAQTASGNTSRPASNTLSSLNSTASFVIVRGVVGENTLLVKQAVAFVLEKDDTLCSYSPFVGDSSDPDAPTPPPSAYTAAQGTPGFRLQYPATGSVTDELILRAPNLGNVDRISAVRINRETRGGTLIVYADPIWPKVETLVLSFSGLSEAEAQDLLTFMEEHIGEDIKLIDWEDRLWTGVLSNIQDPIVQDRRSNCSYTASFEFEGTKV